MSFAKEMQSAKETADSINLRLSLKARIAKGEGKQVITKYFEAYLVEYPGVLLEDGSKTFKQQVYFSCQHVVGANFITCCKDLSAFLAEHGFPEEIVQSFKGEVRIFFIFS